LYEKLGFVRDGIRKNYYTAPVENAVTMTVRQELNIL
jgi:ribosomal protein S18 acetylase RimI-like enzyme